MNRIMWHYAGVQKIALIAVLGNWLCWIVPSHAQAQSYTLNTIFTFSGASPTPANPTGDLVTYEDGLVGTSEHGGNGGGSGHGTVFMLKQHGGGWTLDVLNAFAGPGGGPSGTDGANPVSGVILGPDAFYGVTPAAGAGDCSVGGSCGVVYCLVPPAVAHANANSSYDEYIPWVFNASGSGTDAIDPYGAVVFDSSGDLYGTSRYGGADACPMSGSNPQANPYDCGTVYELGGGHCKTGGWTESSPFPHQFPAQAGDGVEPTGSLVFDSAGNLWGTTQGGGSTDFGSVFELSPSGSGWTEPCLKSFDGGSSLGSYPNGGLYFASGNLWGVTADAGANGLGTFFEVTGSGSSCALNSILSFGPIMNMGAHLDLAGPRTKLVSDSSGNFYGVTTTGGAYSYGSVFMLSQAGGQWSATTIYSFCQGGLPSCSDGAYPVGGVVVDSSGNVYGTTYNGGNSSSCSSTTYPLGCGTAYELSPG